MLYNLHVLLEFPIYNLGQTPRIILTSHLHIVFQYENGLHLNYFYYVMCFAGDRLEFNTFCVEYISINDLNILSLN